MIIDVDDMTLGTVLQRVAQERSRNTFLLCEGESKSYGEFLDCVDAISRGLLSCGIKHGDKVALWAGNSIEWVECYFAVVSIGATLVTVNTRYHASELRYQLEQSDAKLIILERKFLKEDLLERLIEVVPQLTTQDFGSVSNDDVPCLKGAIIFDGDGPRGARSLANIVADGASIDSGMLKKAHESSKPDDVALMIYTSGTTGRPKGVEQQHSALLHRMREFCVWNQMKENDATFFALPLFHSFGAVVAVLGSLITGSRLCMLKKFRAHDALRLIEQERCTVIHGVPSSFYMMLKEPDFSSFDLSSGRTGVLGGAPCSPELAREIMDKIAPAIAAAWGQTETCGMVTASAPGDNEAQICETVGRVIPGSEVCVVDPATGLKVAQGEKGEVVVKSRFIMKGYYKMPRETAETIDAGGLLHTGDIGLFDGDGCLRIAGRLKDMFIVGGVNAYPVEIENHILKLEGVDQVQVVGVPDERLGEVACAYVVKRSGSTIGVDDIIEHCRILANYKIPRHVRFVDAFPTTANGKVKKYVLKEWFEQGK